MLTQEQQTHFQYKNVKPSLWVIVISDNNSSVDVRQSELNSTNTNCQNKPTIQNAWEQAQKLTSNRHIVTIAMKKQRIDFRKIGKKNIPGEIIYQPGFHGNAAAIYLGLTHILAKDPKATVVIFPTDDYYRKFDTKLTEYINQALKQHLEYPNKITIIADYTSEKADKRERLIELQDNSIRNNDHDSLLPIVKIHDRPRLSLMNKLIHSGALQSTGVIISKVKLLWQCCKQVIPDLFEKMEYLYQVILHFKGDKIGEDYVKMATSHAFYHLQDYNFYKDLLNNCLDKCQAFQVSSKNSNPDFEFKVQILVH